ncbi:MAG: hypothetical protein JSR46_05485, partial [Verrucomicrobia bacterium]|nr:hypothetical protein [Verrucomicrobiota bacterium]
IAKERLQLRDDLYRKKGRIRNIEKTLIPGKVGEKTEKIKQRDRVQAEIDFLTGRINYGIRIDVRKDQKYWPWGITESDRDVSNAERLQSWEREPWQAEKAAKFYFGDPDRFVEKRIGGNPLPAEYRDTFVNMAIATGNIFHKVEDAAELHAPIELHDADAALTMRSVEGFSMDSVRKDAYFDALKRYGSAYRGVYEHVLSKEHIDELTIARRVAVGLEQGVESSTQANRNEGLLKKITGAARTGWGYVGGFFGSLAERVTGPSKAPLKEGVRELCQLHCAGNVQIDTVISYFLENAEELSTPDGRILFHTLIFESNFLLNELQKPQAEVLLLPRLRTLFHRGIVAAKEKKPENVADIYWLGSAVQNYVDFVATSNKVNFGEPVIVLKGLFDDMEAYAAVKYEKQWPLVYNSFMAACGNLIHPPIDSGDKKKLAAYGLLANVMKGKYELEELEEDLFNKKEFAPRTEDLARARTVLKAAVSEIDGKTLNECAGKVLGAMSEPLKNPAFTKANIDENSKLFVNLTENILEQKFPKLDKNSRIAIAAYMVNTSGSRRESEAHLKQKLKITDQQAQDCAGSIYDMWKTLDAPGVFVAADNKTVLSLTDGKLESTSTEMFQQYNKRVDEKLALSLKGLYTDCSSLRYYQDGNMACISDSKNGLFLKVNQDNGSIYVKKGDLPWCTFIAEGKKVSLNNRTLAGLHQWYDADKKVVYFCDKTTFKPLYCSTVDGKSIEKIRDDGILLTLGVPAEDSLFATFEDSEHIFCWNSKSSLKLVEFPRLQLALEFNGTRWELQGDKNWLLAEQQSIPRCEQKNGFLLFENKKTGEKKAIFHLWDAPSSRYIEYGVRGDTLVPKDAEARFYLSRIDLARGNVEGAEELLYARGTEITSRKMSEREVTQLKAIALGGQDGESARVLRLRMHALYLLDKNKEQFPKEVLVEAKGAKKEDFSPEEIKAETRLVDQYLQKSKSSRGVRDIEPWKELLVLQKLPKKGVSLSEEQQVRARALSELLEPEKLDKETIAAVAQVHVISRNACREAGLTEKELEALRAIVHKETTETEPAESLRTRMNALYLLKTAKNKQLFFMGKGEKEITFTQQDRQYELQLVRGYLAKVTKPIEATKELLVLQDFKADRAVSERIGKLEDTLKANTLPQLGFFK